MEVWKDIEGFEGLYQISSLGNVKTLSYGPKNVRQLSNKSKILKQSLSSSGYLHVQLYKQGKSKTIMTHILVAKAFVDNPSNKREVNHIDGNKSNNNMNNLEWVTRSENLSHAIKLGLRKPPMLNKKGKDNKNRKPVIQYSKDGELIKTWDSIADAARYYGTTISAISSCTHGRKKTCVNYKWVSPI